MAQKMFLVSPHQLRHLTPSAVTSIRQNAEDDLDQSMRTVLNEQGLNPDEKIKKYDALLQRYLSFMKQGRKEERRVTLSVQPEREEQGEPLTEQQRVEEVEEGEDPMSEVLKALPPRNRKNGEYIMRRLKKNAGGGWSSLGEFIHQGHVVKGSHMIDLIKNLSSQKKTRSPSPGGWDKFLQALSTLNIPVSYVTNPEAREQYRRLKDAETHTKTRTSPNIILSPQWSQQTPQQKPRSQSKPRSLPTQQWASIS